MILFEHARGKSRFSVGGSPSLSRSNCGLSPLHRFLRDERSIRKKRQTRVGHDAANASMPSVGLDAAHEDIATAAAQGAYAPSKMWAKTADRAAQLVPVARSRLSQYGTRVNCPPVHLEEKCTGRTRFRDDLRGVIAGRERHELAGVLAVPRDGKCPDRGRRRFDLVYRGATRAGTPASLVFNTRPALSNGKNGSANAFGTPKPARRARAPRRESIPAANCHRNHETGDERLVRRDPTARSNVDELRPERSIALASVVDLRQRHTG